MEGKDNTDNSLSLDVTAVWGFARLLEPSEATVDRDSSTALKVDVQQKYPTLLFRT